MGRVDGKVALISGGARGMGAAHARMLVDEGGKVVIGDILDDEGKALADEIGDSARYIHLDVTEPDQWQAAVDLISKGAVDADKMITGEYDLSEGDAAFHDIKEPAGTRLKLLFRVSGAL